METHLEPETIAAIKDAISGAPTEVMNISSSEEESPVGLRPQEPLAIEATVLAPWISSSAALEETLSAAVPTVPLHW
ncbi:uncharacterized protein A4U43_C02F15190 [Asparagus officinalis]|uniref:Uncharacterized protein n=1 Tax=Asparagus officinalis TaxID=4686 RepID=A0A5P1FIE3_ASPOF|nr:uncharacterized protein A4U43_C02F15190 [Asparagus officinalis]